MRAIQRPTDDALRDLMRAIVRGNETRVRQQLERVPGLVTASLATGASRREAKAYFFDAIKHYAYAGDTALHIAAAGYQTKIARLLVTKGANVRARNRFGNEPLHYAVAGGPQSAFWNPRAQSALITYLIEMGADVNAVTKTGVAPLHSAVRNRCSSAVRTLLEHGADPKSKNGRGSTPLKLARLTTGRGGTGRPESKVEQQKIIELLERVT